MMVIFFLLFFFFIDGYADSMRPVQSYNNMSPYWPRFAKEACLILTGDPIMDEWNMKRKERERDQEEVREMEPKNSPEWEALKDRECQKNLEASNLSNPMELSNPKE